MPFASPSSGNPLLGGGRGMGESSANFLAEAGCDVAVLDVRMPPSFRDEGVRAATQILLTARDELASERTRTVNALTALLRITDLGIDSTVAETGNSTAR